MALPRIPFYSCGDIATLWWKSAGSFSKGYPSIHQNPDGSFRFKLLLEVQGHVKMDDYFHRMAATYGPKGFKSGCSFGWHKQLEEDRIDFPYNMQKVAAHLANEMNATVGIEWKKKWLFLLTFESYPKEIRKTHYFLRSTGNKINRVLEAIIAEPQTEEE